MNILSQWNLKEFLKNFTNNQKNKFKLPLNIDCNLSEFSAKVLVHWFEIIDLTPAKLNKIHASRVFSQSISSGLIFKKINYTN